MDAACAAWDALIVAGGRGTRLGGVSKPALMLGDRTLLDRTLDAVTGATRTVLVGGPRRDGVLWTVEEPAGAGPAAAVGAGLDALARDAYREGQDPAPWTVVVAVDLPGLARGIGRMLDARAQDGAWLVDAGGRPQALLAVYRTQALAARCEDTMDGWSMRRLVEGLRMVAVPDVRDASHDVDTWDDVELWKGRLA